MIGIYKFTNKYNKKSYIGKSKDIERRKLAHYKRACSGMDGYFYNAIRKYGIEGFDFNILIECPKENLNYWEKFYIKYYGSNLHDYGYNKTLGGDGGFTGLNNGCFQKGNTINKGRKQTDEHKHNSSIAHKHPWTDKQRESYNKRVEEGKNKLSEETISRMKESQSKIKHDYLKGKHWRLDETTNKRVYYD